MGNTDVVPACVMSQVASWSVKLNDATVGSFCRSADRAEKTTFVYFNTLIEFYSGQNCKKKKYDYYISYLHYKCVSRNAYVVMNV